MSKVLLSIICMDYPNKLHGFCNSKIDGLSKTTPKQVYLNNQFCDNCLTYLAFLQNYQKLYNENCFAIFICNRKPNKHK